MPSTLEVLTTARAKIAGDPASYVFPDWNACTCGHIYQAAGGEPDGYGSYTRQFVKNDAYNEAARHVLRAATAAGIAPTPQGFALHDEREKSFDMSYATGRLSDILRDLGYPVQDTARLAAIALYDAAIETIQHEHEQARLDVLDATRRIIDDAEIPEPAHA